MKKHNYLVSVFVGGRNVNSYYSENLDDLVTIKALHKNCEIEIFNYSDFSYLSEEQVAAEIRKSGERWKKSKDSPVGEATGTVAKKPFSKRRQKVKKYWERPIVCVETGQVFSSIKECSDHLGISHKSIWNAINSGNPRRGLHFVNATKTEQNSCDK